MRMLSAMLGLTLIVWLAPPTVADDKEEPKGVRAVLIEKFQDLQLTEEQESKIADLRKEYHPKVQEAAKELRGLVKEEVQKIRAVLTEEQREKIKELRAERHAHIGQCVAHAMAHLKSLDLTDAEVAKMAEIRKEFRPKIAKTLRELHGLLNDEQRQTWAAAVKAGKKRREALAALKLTADQKDKVATVGKEVRDLVREEMEKVRDVLTEEQKAKLLELKNERKERVRDRMACRISKFKDLNLSDEQKEKINEIRTQYRPRVREAGNKLRATIREEVEAIVAVIKS
jgi:Spy/CpxP family protein refolding chaperone